MDVEVQRLDPLKPTIYQMDRSSHCVQQTLNRVYYTLVTSCCLLLFYYFLFAPTVSTKPSTESNIPSSQPVVCRYLMFIVVILAFYLLLFVFFLS